MALVCLVAFASGCGKVAQVPTFGSLRSGSASTNTTTKKGYSWYGPALIDAGTGDVNNDLNTTCTTNTAVATRGCMQPPAMIYSDSRWFVGFFQNYLSILPTHKYSLFAALTSVATGYFGGLGTGLTIIDSGRGIDPVTTAASSRYVRYAKFPNGNVIAVYWLEETNGAGPRTVYATIYNAQTDTWGATTQISTGGANNTDTGIDSTALGYRATFCRPTVATSGDGTALVSWCENTGLANTISEVRYRKFLNGAWGAITSLADSTISDVTLPGFTGVNVDLTATLGTAGTDLTTAVVAGDIYQTSLNVDAATGTDVATVMGVDSFAVAGQFNIVKDFAGVVQVCSTLQNMMNAILSKPVFNTSLAAVIPGVTLSQIGVAAILDSGCTQNDRTTWKVSLYHNRQLSNQFRVQAGAQIPHNVIDAAGFTVTTSALSPAARAAGGIPAPTATPLTLAQEGHWQSAAVDVAGDGFGNYAMVRSMVSPFFQNNDITATGIDRARMLVGHSFNAATGLVTTTTHTLTVPVTSFVSRQPSCFNGTQYVKCSVRNPKILMSNSGKGLILFHQNQPNSYLGTPPALVTDTTRNPNRLYFSTYTTGAGFSGVAAPLDLDVLCGSSSVDNDRPVFETAAYDVASGIAGQNMGEPLATNQFYTGSTAAQVTDVPPIAAAMDSVSGKGVVAFHKIYYDGVSSTLTCGSFVRMNVAVYDPTSGFSTIEQIDDGLGNTGHSAVSISPSGYIAVVWEQSVQQTDLTFRNFVYLRVRSPSGAWGSIVQANLSHTDPKDSMFPSVGISDDGTVVVTYTFGSRTAVDQTRRQYVYHYFYH